jgi:glycosyltransferase involved in cell wall biosynthesis
LNRVVIIGALPESLLLFRGDLLKTMVTAGYAVTAMAAPADQGVIEQLKALGVRFKAYPVQRNGINPLRDTQTYFALRKALYELKPDVVLSYTIKPVIWGGIALKGMSATRFYALITGLGFAFQDGDSFLHTILTSLVIRLYRFSLTKASRVIFQNTDDRELFIAKQIIKIDKSELVNGSGVDLDHFAVANLPNNDVVFLTIGRLLGSKGFREYAKAARLVKLRYPKVLFKLVGPADPSLDGISLAEVKSWHDGGVIQYLGETRDVRPFINDCNVYVLPSYHEGMPRTVLEAMAIGRPILTTDVPGCRETVIVGENGYLVPKADPEALAERMIWFIENRDKLERMGQASRRIAEEKFEVHKINEKMLHIMGLKAARGTI